MQQPAEAASGIASNSAAPQTDDKPFYDDDLREDDRMWAEEICREDEDATAEGLLHDSVGRRNL